MADIHIELSNGRLEYGQNEMLEGKVRWNVDQAKSAILRFFWRTEGKGIQDLGLQEELSFDTPRTMDERSFRFKVPAGPWSYDGKLVSIRWTLEFQVEPGGHVESLDV